MLLIVYACQIFILLLSLTIVIKISLRCQYKFTQEEGEIKVESTLNHTIYFTDELNRQLH